MDPNDRPAGGSSFYSEEELTHVGFKAYGTDVMVSRKASIYKPEAISMGSHVRIDDFCLLSGGAGILLGNYVHLAPYVALYGGAGIIIEDFAGLSSRSAIYSESDDFTGRSMGSPLIPREFKKTFKSAPVILRKHSAVGTNATILPGVEMGEGSAAGAHALIVKSIAPWTIHFVDSTHRILRRRADRIRELERRFLASRGETLPPTAEGDGHG